MSEAPPSLARRLWAYQAERFPLGKTTLLVAVFSAAGVSASAHFAGRALPGWPAFALAFAVTLLFFFHLRVLDEIKDRMAADGLDNVVTVLGDQQRTGLAPGCCDRVLLRLVYHHFAEPQTMRRGLWEALRPGGLIAVIDVPPKKSWPVVSGAPDRGGHGIEAKELLADMRGSGFELVTQHDDWPAESESYCVVFRRPADR